MIGEVTAEVVRVVMPLEPYAFCMMCESRRRRRRFGRLVVKAWWHGEASELCICGFCAKRYRVKGAPDPD